jgi:DNA recombination protein RmuC
VLVALLAAGVIVLGYLWSRRGREDLAATAAFRNLTELLAGVQAELRGVSERVSSLERANSQVAVDVTAVASRLAETGAVAGGLAEASSAMRAQLMRAQESLTVLETQTLARRDTDSQMSASIRRLEAVIAGSQSKGVAGENVVDRALAQLPPEWQARNFRLGNKVVEFGLRLPNGLVLPIDSKWSATALLERLAASDDPAERRSIRSKVEREVVGRAKEIRKYLDPSVTAGYAVAVVPDAVYQACSRAQVEAFRLDVVVIGYSLFVPYLLLVFNTVLRTSYNLDLSRMADSLVAAKSSLEALQEEIEGRFARAVTMLDNSRDEMRAHLGRATTGLIALEARASEGASVGRRVALSPEGVRAAD